MQRFRVLAAPRAAALVLALAALMRVVSVEAACSAAPTASTSDGALSFVAPPAYGIVSGVTSTANGVLVYDSTNKLFKYCDGTSWQTLSTGTTPASGSSGYVQFNTSGAFDSDSNFYWDSTNHRLGIGTTSPTQRFEVSGPGARFYNSGSGDLTISHAGNVSTVQAASSVQLALGAGGAEAVRIGTSGNVGIGTTSPTAKLDVRGNVANTANTVAQAIVSPVHTSTGSYTDYALVGANAAKIASGVTNSALEIGIYSYALRNYTTTTDSGTLTAQEAVQIGYGHYNSDAAATPTTTSAYGLVINPYYKTGTITNMYDLYLNADSTGGTVTNRYGIYQANTAANYFGGNVGIGTGFPNATLDVYGYAKLKTNASQPVACSATYKGSIAMTSSSNYLCYCDGASWKQVHSPATACTW